MSRIIGTVTRSSPDTIVDSQQTAQGNRATFSAATGGMSLGGSFRSVREAQMAVQSALGGAQARWTREDMPGRIERYVARTGRDGPAEIYGVDLGAWSEMDAGVMFVGAGPPDVRLVGDRSGNGNHLTSVVDEEPALAPAGFGGIPTLSWSADQRMTTPLAVTETQTFSWSVVASRGGDVGVETLLTNGGTPALQLVGRAGLWSVLSDGLAIDVAVSAQVAVVLQVVNDPAAVAEPLSLWLNGVLVGRSTGGFGAGALVLSTTADPFLGRLSALVVGDADTNKLAQMYRYLQQRYNIDPVAR